MHIHMHMHTHTYTCTHMHMHRYITKDEPLAALACCSVWVMQTLSHHVENIDDWVPLLQVRIHIYIQLHIHIHREH